MRYLSSKPARQRSARILLAVCWLGFAQLATAQQPRLSDHNTIGWLANFTTLRFAKSWSGHLEYQLRRSEFIATGQQNLLRVGINYTVNDQLTLRAGYAWAETYPYGDYPIQGSGREFPEHRTYQMATLSNPIGRAGITHRFILEQRWVGAYSQPTLPDPDRINYLNRARYMLRVQIPVPIGKPAMGDKTAYLAAYDEVFIGFGRNVGANVFDQNRLGLLVGYRFSPVFRIEGGFLQQLSQLGRLVDNRTVFQYNNGLIINTYIDLDLRKN